MECSDSTFGIFKLFLIMENIFVHNDKSKITSSMKTIYIPAAYMEYIPELVVPTMISLIECCFNKEATKPKVPSG
jgi:hypothetical protein